MKTREEIHALLQGMNCNEVSRQTGVAHYVVRQIRNEKNYNPQYETIKRLSDYFEERGE